MPWRECSVMDERVRFIGCLLDGEGMSELCREFGISRKTGYKIFNRYRQDGVEALTDRSRRPVRYANQLADQLEAMIVRLKREKPHWGARKIRELLVRRLNGDVQVPATSTVHAVLDRHGLVKRARQRRRFTAEGTPLSLAIAPNDLWCPDFKGEFKLGNGRYCYPRRSPTRPRACFWPAKPLRQRRKTASSEPSSASSPSATCPMPSAATTACRSSPASGAGKACDRLPLLRLHRSP